MTANYSNKTIARIAVRWTKQKSTILIYQNQLTTDRKGYAHNTNCA